MKQENNNNEKGGLSWYEGAVKGLKKIAQEVKKLATENSVNLSKDASAKIKEIELLSDIYSLGAERKVNSLIQFLENFVNGNEGKNLFGQTNSAATLMEIERMKFIPSSKPEQQDEKVNVNLADYVDEKPNDTVNLNGANAHPNDGGDCCNIL
jgi:ABC-type transporter Mla subunit MlaD